MVTSNRGGLGPVAHSFPPSHQAKTTTMSTTCQRSVPDPPLRCPRGSVGAGGGSIPRWSASKPQVVTRRKAKGAGQKKST